MIFCLQLPKLLRTSTHQHIINRTNTINTNININICGCGIGGIGSLVVLVVLLLVGLGEVGGAVTCKLSSAASVSRIRKRFGRFLDSFPRFLSMLAHAPPHLHLTSEISENLVAPNTTALPTSRLHCHLHQVIGTRWSCRSCSWSYCVDVIRGCRWCWYSRMDML